MISFFFYFLIFFFAFVNIRFADPVELSGEAKEDNDKNVKREESENFFKSVEKQTAEIKIIKLESKNDFFNFKIN